MGLFIWFLFKLSFSLVYTFAHYCVYYNFEEIKLFTTVRLLVKFLRSLAYKVISSSNRDVFSFSFFIWFSFISFCFLTVIAKTSRSVMNKSKDGGHSYLVPDFNVNALNCSPFSMVLLINLLYISFNMLRHIPCSFHSTVLLSRKDAGFFFKGLFFSSNQMIMRFLILSLFVWTNNIYWSMYVEPHQNCWNKANLVVTNDLSNIILGLFW